MEIAKRNLEILKKTSATEQDVKRFVVEPIMLWAGIDIYDPNVIREEYSVQQIENSARADFAIILLNKTPQIAIEVKNIGEELDKSLNQFIDYCNYKNIRFGLITNGREWWFVDKTKRDSQDQVFLKIELGSKYIELIKLMNPSFSDILEAFAKEYGTAQNGGILNLQVLYEETIKTIEKREDQKRSQPGNSEPLSSSLENEFNVKFEELFNFASRNRKRDLTRDCPPNIMLGGEKIDIKNWRTILLNLINDTFNSVDKAWNKLKDIKITPGSQFHLITLEKESDDLNRYSELKINDTVYYVYTALNFNSMINNINEITTRYFPKDYIKFPRTWFEGIKKKFQ